MTKKKQPASDPIVEEILDAEATITWDGSEAGDHTDQPSDKGGIADVGLSA